MKNDPLSLKKEMLQMRAALERAQLADQIEHSAVVPVIRHRLWSSLLSAKVWSFSRTVMKHPKIIALAWSFLGPRIKVKSVITGSVAAWGAWQFYRSWKKRAG